MDASSIGAFAQLLDAAGCQPHLNGDRLEAICPFHLGYRPSLIIWLDESNELRKKCLEGCSSEQIDEELEKLRYSHSPIAGTTPNGEATQAVPNSAAAESPDRVVFDLTDDGNALRFAARYSDRVRFVHGPDRWLIWDACRWASDDGGQVVELAREMVRAIADEAADAPTPKRADQLMSWAGKSHEEPRIRRTLILARSDPRLAVTPDELDSDPWQLNALNGTIDLKTGRLNDHCRADLITKLAPVEYDPEARLPLWNRLLNDATGGYGSEGDPETIDFVQRAAGYSASGDSREEVLLFVHGPTCSCKSTFIEAIKAALGDYAVTADFEAFLDRRQVGGARNDIARLAGARLVSSIEVDEGSRLAGGLVKMLTGRDTVTARFLYSESFEFAPTFTIWLVANHTPRVNPEDGAMWRRILLVPFTHTVPPDMVDPKVKVALTDPKVAGSTVLAWIVKGCLRWREDGLQVPESVRAATAAYRRDQDPLADFVDECLVFAPSSRLTPLRSVRPTWRGVSERASASQSG